LLLASNEEKEILRRQMEDKMEDTMKRTEEKKPWNHRRMYIFIFVVVVIIAGVGAYFGTRDSSTDNAEGGATLIVGSTPAPTKSPTKSPTNPPTPAPTPAPTTLRCSMLEAILVDHDPLHVDAKNWLCNDDTWVPPANDFDSDRLWNERYAMAVFYFSTNWNGWIIDDGWLSSTSVCDWYTRGNPCGGSDSRVTEINVGESCLSVFPPVAQLQQVCHLT
jgi:hypothetical protein